jgi:protocatechuate 3,4-dioxygenase beta subunit
MKPQARQIIILAFAVAVGVLLLIQGGKMRPGQAPEIESSILKAREPTGTSPPTPSPKSARSTRKASGQSSETDEDADKSAARGKTRTGRGDHATTKTLRVKHGDEVSSGVISGIVRDKAGAAVVQDALIQLFKTEELSTPFRSQNTPQSGQFRFAALPASMYEVQASHADYASECITNIALKKDQKIEGMQVILARGAELKGLVVDASDKPLERVRVQALKKIFRVNPSGGEARSGTYKSAETQTDKAGQFAFPHVPEGENQIVAQKDGYAIETVPMILTEGAAPQEIKIVLKAAGIIGGQVLSPTRKPIAKAKVSATFYLGEEGKKSKVENVAPAISNDSGQFMLKNLLSAGAYDVTVEAENYARGFFHRVNVNTLNNTFILQNGGSISGVVKHLETNRPVKGVPLVVTSEDEKFPYSAQTVSNEKGLYAFLGISPGTYTVAVNSTRLTAQEHKDVKVESNKDVTGIDFLVYQGITVQGKVVDAATGAAVASAEVTARARLGALLGKSAEVTTKTDSSGGFVIKNLPAGIYYFTATAEGYLKINDATKQQKVELAINKPPPFVKLKVYRGGEVGGKVMNEGGSAVPFALVQLFQSPQTPTRIDTKNLEAVTDIMGNFGIKGIWLARPLELYASAYRACYAKGKSERVILTDDSPSVFVTIILKKGILLTGTVTDSTKAPIRDAVVSVSPVMFEGDRFTAPYVANSSERGVYQVADLPTGKAEVRATAAGYAPFTKQISLSPDEPIENLDIVLSQGLMISGYAIDDFGSPLENAHVSVTNPYGAGRPTVTDSIGHYQLLDLENQHYDLMAQLSRDTPTGRRTYQSRRLGIAAGRENVSFVFPINGAMQGRVVDDTNSVPVKQFSASLSGNVETGDTTTGGFALWNVNFSDSGGEFRLTDLPTGLYTLIFAADGYAKLELNNIKVESPSLRQLGDIGLHSGGSVRGRVVSARTGDAVPDVRGNMEPQPGGTGGSNLDGILTIDHLAAGSYKLTLTHSHYLPRTVSPVVVEQDKTTELGDIALTPGGIVEGSVSDGDGEPLAGIKVSVDVSYDTQELAAYTDVGGYYFIDGVPEGLTRVRAEGVVNGQQCFRTRAINVRADERVTVDFVLDPRCNISGRIYSAVYALTNLSIVTYQIDELDCIDTRMKTAGVVSPDGTYRISDIVPGDYLVIAEGKVMNAPQGASSRPIRTFERVAVYNTETVKDIEFSNAQVEGIISARRDGKAIKGAQLRLTYNDAPQAPDQIATRYLSFSARTDNDGFFQIYGLPPGHYDLFASRPSGNWEHCESIYLSGSSDTAQITCTID